LLRQIVLALRALLLAHPPEDVLRELELLESNARKLLSEPTAAAATEHAIMIAVERLWPERSDAAERASGAERRGLSGELAHDARLSRA
jgi:hypothetical protein